MAISAFVFGLVIFLCHFVATQLLTISHFIVGAIYFSVHFHFCENKLANNISFELKIVFTSLLNLQLLIQKDHKSNVANQFPWGFVLNPGVEAVASSSFALVVAIFSNVMTTTNGIRTDALRCSVFALMCESKRSLIEFLFPQLICVRLVFLCVLPMCLASGFDMLPNGINFRHLAFYASHCCSFRSIPFHSNPLCSVFVFQTHNTNRDNTIVNVFSS